MVQNSDIPETWVTIHSGDTRFKVNYTGGQKYSDGTWEFTKFFIYCDINSLKNLFNQIMVYAAPTLYKHYKSGRIPDYLHVLEEYGGQRTKRHTIYKCDICSENKLPPPTIHEFTVVREGKTGESKMRLCTDCRNMNQEYKHQTIVREPERIVIPKPPVLTKQQEEEKKKQLDLYTITDGGNGILASSSQEEEVEEEDEEFGDDDENKKHEDTNNTITPNDIQSQSQSQTQVQQQQQQQQQQKQPKGQPIPFNTKADPLDIF